MTSDDTATVVLRPAVAADRDLIRAWLADPAVQRWWGTLASAEAEFTLAMSSTSAICRIIEAGGEPVGYAHAVDATMWGGELPDGLPPGTWDIDLFVGSPTYRGRGIGQCALRLLTDEVFTTTLAVACCIFASVRNEAAIRAYEKAGYRWVRIVEDAIFGPSWMLLRDRSPSGGR